MDVIANFLTGILPELIAGLFGFLLAKYSYHKSIPLDKLEITYNRVYYPLYCLKKNDDILQFIKESEFYLKKYNKYVDRSTRIAFENLKKNPEDQDLYYKFQENISDINRNLRRKLGYLEFNDFSVYKYLAPKDRCKIRLMIECIGMFLSIVTYIEFANSIAKNIVFLIGFICFVAILTEIILVIVNLIGKNLHKAYEKIKQKHKAK